MWVSLGSSVLPVPGYLFPSLGLESFQPSSSNTFLIPFSLFSFWNLYNANTGNFNVISESLYVANVLFLSVYFNCVISIILSPRSLMNSSVELGLLFIPSIVLFQLLNSFLLGLFIFSNSLLKSLLCTSTLLPNSVIILLLMLWILYLINCFFLFFPYFLLFFQFRVVPLPFHFV